ncbi:MAG: CHASE2 domain-containing protein, partial [Candidatus Thermochlorobacter sp.]
MFQDAATRLGVVNFQSDQDGIARRVPLLCKLGEKTLPYFGLSCFLISKGIENIDSLLQAVPTANDGNFLLYWYGKGGAQGAFKYYPAAALIASAIQLEQGETPDISPNEFQGKHVIIGASAAGLLDFKPTPFTVLEPYPGMEIHATMLANLLNGHFLREPPRWVSYFIALMLAVAASASLFLLNRASLSVVLIGFLVLLYLSGAYVAFASLRWWIPVTLPLVSLLLTFALAAVVSYATEGREKRELRKAFNRYLSPRVIDSIVENPDEIELGGKEVEATVFFSDIEGFTSISEK